MNAPLPAAYPAPDAITLILYAAVFVAITLLTLRRPAYGAAALILFQPFAFYGDVFDTTITLPKVVLLAVLLGVLAYRGSFEPIGGPIPAPLLTAGGLVLAAILLSDAHAAHHGAVMREALKTLEYLVLFATVVAAYRLDPQRESIATALLAVTIAVSLLALAQEAIGAPSGLLLNGQVVPRIAGPLEGPNQLAGYFDVALPVAFALAVDRPSTLAFAAIFFAVFADVLTFSRGGAIGAVAGVLVVGLTLRSGLGRSLRFMAGGLLAGIAVALIWSVAAHSALLALARLFGNEPNYAGGVGTRPELWHAAYRLWREHPFFGVGAGNFELEIPLTGLRGIRTHANSLYLQSLVEGGIPLFAATVYLVYTSIASFARERRYSPFVTGAFAASIALALHQIVDFLTFYPKVGGEWWIVMALGAAEITAAVQIGRACA